MFKFFFSYKNIRSKYEAEKVAIWQHFLISDKHRTYPFLIYVFCPSQIKNSIITGRVSNFFNALCNRVTSSLQKRKHHKSSLNCRIGSKSVISLMTSYFRAWKLSNNHNVVGYSIKAVNICTQVYFNNIPSFSA